MKVGDVLSFVPNLGDWLSQATVKISHFISSYGYNLTDIQSKIILLIIFGVIITLGLTLLKGAIKILKWVIVGLTIFLAISVITSLI
jgi:hypothetical protein